MVTMNTDKPASRKQEIHHHGILSPYEHTSQMLIYQKMENFLQRMRDEEFGVPVRTIKNFMNKIPAVFTGSDLIMWMVKNLDVDDQAEAQHLAYLIASHGYLFPIDDHILTVKNDNTFYRFQTPYFWPSNNLTPENTDYAIYLFKRTLLNKNKVNLSEFEAENFSFLQEILQRKWEFITMQAEMQSKVDKKREKMERKVLESQEKAFWDVHRPLPGYVNTTELDIRKIRPAKPIKLKQPPPRSGLCAHDFSIPIIINEGPSDSYDKSTTEAMKKEITTLKIRLERRNIKLPKIAESYIMFYEQYIEYDAYFTAPENSNPWISDSTEFWEMESVPGKEPSVRRVKRWAFSLQEVLADHMGRQHFMKFLEKEFSSENLKFWEAVQHMKSLPLTRVKKYADEIWTEYLALEATCPINVDSHSHELTRKHMDKPDRWTFDIAAGHVYHLMKSDSYPRYIRSEMYKEFLVDPKKKLR